MPPGQNGVFQMSRISGWNECKQGLGQRCQDDRGSYTQCCEITWMKYTSLDCVSLSFWLRSWPTCSPWEALHFQKTLGSPCAVFISSDTMPGTLGSGRHENNGFLSLEGDWNVCYQAQQLAAVFTDHSGEQGIPSQYPRGLELDGSWEGVCVGGGVSCSIIHGAQLFPTVCLSSGALSFCWYSFPLRWTHMQTLMCEVKFSGPGGGQEGHLSTQHHPLPHGWTRLRIYSTPSLCGCRRKGLERHSSFSGSHSWLVEELTLAPPRYLHSAARALWVPYSGCVQCAWHTLESSPTMPLFWALWVCKCEYRAPSSDKKQTPTQMSLSKKG